MPRPKTKPELLDLSKKNFDLLNSFVDSLSKEEQNKEFPKGTMNRNIRDVLGHLYHWHLMFLDWYKIGMKGQKGPMPAEGYSWKDVPRLNRKIREEYSKVALNEMKKRFKQTHNKVYKIIEGHTNTEIFEKKRYKWTGTTSLGAYLVGATSSHYDWALKLIKKAVK